MDFTKLKQAEIRLATNEWVQTTLGEIAVFNYGKSLPESKRIRGGVPVYGSSGVAGWHNHGLVDGGGLIIGRKGTVGSVYKVKGPFFPIDTVYYVRGKDTTCDLDFLYYLLSSLRLTDMNSDSAVPGLNRDRAYAIVLRMPKKRNEQIRIASILSSLDDKIELNRQMNKTLEEIASTIFKHWFVDFDFPNEQGKPYKSSGGKMVPSELGEIPEGWSVLSLDKIANFLNGLALQKYPPNEKGYLPVIKIRELKNGITDSTDRASVDIGQRYIVDDGDVLFSWSGSLEIVLWCGGKGALNQHLFRVTSQEYPKWFYYYAIKSFLAEFQEIAAGKAVTMGHIKREHLSISLVAVPNADILDKMNSVMAPIIEQMINNNVQMRTLVNTRDSLLPRLMSGRIRVTA